MEKKSLSVDRTVKSWPGHGRVISLSNSRIQDSNLLICLRKNKLVYFTPRITAPGCMQHLCLITFSLFSYGRDSRSYTRACSFWSFQKLLKGITYGGSKQFPGLSKTQILMAHYNHSLSIDATIMEHVGIIFVTQQVTIATPRPVKNTLNFSFERLYFKNGTVNFFIIEF